MSAEEERLSSMVADTFAELALDVAALAVAAQYTRLEVLPCKTVNTIGTERTKNELNLMG